MTNYPFAQSGKVYSKASMKIFERYQSSDQKNSRKSLKTLEAIDSKTKIRLQTLGDIDNFEMKQAETAKKKERHGIFQSRELSSMNSQTLMSSDRKKEDLIYM